VPESVTLGYVHSDQVSYSWHRSLDALATRDRALDGPLQRGGWLAVRCGTDGLPAARNETVLQFLATTSDWLFWIDTDMGFQPDIVDRLLAAADPVERPIVGALCFAQRELAGDGAGGYRCKATPTIYDWTNGVDMKGHHREGFVARTEYEVGALQQCGATGSAAILIHRSVFEKIRDSGFGPTWYNRAPQSTEPDARGVVTMLGEDMSFCMRVGIVGLPVHVHTGVKTTHHKAIWLGEDDYIDQWTVGQVRAVQAAQASQPVADATSA
jgi:hypothetical protein